MNKIKAVFAFGGPYLARYWQRLVAGILLGVLFGVFNASFVWATKTMFERLGKAPTGLVVTIANPKVNAKLTNTLDAAYGGTVVKAPQFILSGTINCDSAITNAFIHRSFPEIGPAIPVDFSGAPASVNYSNLLVLEPGSNTFIVTAQDYTGNSVSLARSFYLETHLPPNSLFAPIKPKPPTLETRFKARMAEIKKSVDSKIDPWLPRQGRRLDAMQILGGLLLLPFLVALRGIIGYLSTYCLTWVSQRAVNDMRVDILAKLNTLSLDFFHKSKMGDLLTRINGDTASVQRSLSLGFSDLIKEPITIVCIFGALLAVNVRLTLFAACFFPLCVVPIVVLGKKVRKASGHSRTANITQMSLLVEALSGIRIIKAFQLENDQLERFRATCKQMVHHGMKDTQARGLVNPIIEVIALTGLSGLLVFIAYGNVQIDDLIAFLTGIIMLFEPVKKLAAVHVLLEQTSVGVDRLMHLLEEKPSIQEPKSPQALPQFKSAITFEKVDFSYGERPILQQVSLSIPHGYKLGIVGESGAGKSTMINLIMRFYDPISGAVKIDGVDLRNLSFDDLRQKMALVSQEIVIFDESVAENISRGRKGATRAEIEAAAKAAFAHEFIVRLPQGYDTVVGERGQSLSVGQRQRLSIARAFVRNAPILLLDEATASLDSNAENEVQAAIERLEQNKTVICVAHRLSTLADMNLIIVISQDGRIVEKGSFNDLLQNGGIFATMARRQGLSAKGETAV